MPVSRWSAPSVILRQLPVEYYAPEANYGEVRNKWIGFGTAGDE